MLVFVSQIFMQLVDVMFSFSFEFKSIYKNKIHNNSLIKGKENKLLQQIKNIQ